MRRSCAKRKLGQRRGRVVYTLLKEILALNSPHVAVGRTAERAVLVSQCRAASPFHSRTSLLPSSAGRPSRLLAPGRVRLPLCVRARTARAGSGMGGRCGKAAGRKGSDGGLHKAGACCPCSEARTGGVSGSIRRDLCGHEDACERGEWGSARNTIRKSEQVEAQRSHSRSRCASGYTAHGERSSAKEYVHNKQRPEPLTPAKSKELVRSALLGVGLRDRLSCHTRSLRESL